MQDLTYSVPSSHEKGKMAVLLNKVTGYAEPGKMTALVSNWVHVLSRTAFAR